MTTWITDWSEIGDNKKYIVCAINMRAAEKTLYLSNPQILVGWQVKRLLPKCYAAILLPSFSGVDLG